MYCLSDGAAQEISSNGSRLSHSCASMEEAALRVVQLLTDIYGAAHNSRKFGTVWALPLCPEKLAKFILYWSAAHAQGTELSATHTHSG